ncbi:hypothetical protein GOP47_0027543 [Adiantum capillus-veneris]|nr:hypothetical protein GOP47_0027543 [Adiantum capillus-veneris]
MKDLRYARAQNPAPVMQLYHQPSISKLWWLKLKCVRGKKINDVTGVPRTKGRNGEDEMVDSSPKVLINRNAMGLQNLVRAAWALFGIEPLCVSIIATATTLVQCYSQDSSQMHVYSASVPCSVHGTNL